MLLPQTQIRNELIIFLIDEKSFENNNKAKKALCKNAHSLQYNYNVLFKK